MSTVSTLKHLPGPSIWEIIQIPELREKNHIFWNLEYPLSLIKKYGSIVFVKSFNQIIVADPNAIEYILKTNAKNYERYPAFLAKQLVPILGKSLLTMEGTVWKERRKIVQSAFTQAALKSYANIITEQTQKLLASWQSTHPKKINMLDEMSLLTLRIALKILTHRDFTDQTLNNLSFSIEYCMRYAARAKFIHRWKPSLQSLRFFWHIKKIDTFLLAIVQERRREPSTQEDLLTLLVNTDLSDLEIISELKSHIIPGQETTACALSWMWYLLAKHPQYREQMDEELGRVLQGSLPTAESIQQLPITKAIISETLRLYPPIWSTPRTNLAADLINGYEIPAHSNLCIHLYALHRNPDYWEHPNDFMPERFLNSTSNRHGFSFLPFMAGAHTCIASHLGMLELMLTTAEIAQRMRFELPKKSTVLPQPYTSLRPKNGITMHPISRLKSALPLS